MHRVTFLTLSLGTLQIFSGTASFDVRRSDTILTIQVNTFILFDWLNLYILPFKKFSQYQSEKDLCSAPTVFWLSQETLFLWCYPKKRIIKSHFATNKGIIRINLNLNLQGTTSLLLNIMNTIYTLDSYYTVYKYLSNLQWFINLR